MNVLSRPLVAAFCLLFVLLAGLPALGQRFLPQTIIQAETITEEMQDQINVVVDTPLFELEDDEPVAEKVTEARKQLLQLFRKSSDPSDAYLQAISATIEARMKGLVEHEDAMIRMNAMIILSVMVDETSEKWIDAGLKDKNDAVKRWAMEALGQRMQRWKDRGAGGKIDAAIKQIVGIIDVAQPPHPIVVSAGLEALVKVDTTKSRDEVIDLLNKRVALHVADPDLTYTPERAAIEGLTSVLQFQTPPDVRSITGLNRAMVRYAAVTRDQLSGGRIAAELEKDAKIMMLQCFNSLAQLCAAAKAPKPAPADHGQVKGWIANDRWDELKVIIEKDWAEILTAPPFQINAANLKP